MKRTICRLGLFLLAAACAQPGAFGQQATHATQASGSAQQQKQGGTGVVPPGVKLVPQMPPAGLPRPFEFPGAESKTLPNGLRVFVVTDRKEPAVAVRLLIMSAGGIKDPADVPGTAAMVANMLTQGTEKRSARDIAEAIDFVGGSLNASAGKDATAVTLDVVKKDLDVGLDLMSDVVLHPSFRADELERQRQQLLSSLTVQYSDPNYLASAVFSRVVYGSSPYGWPSDGTPETAAKLNRDELAKFHDATYAPNDALIAFSGDINAEDAFAAAEKYFGSWPKKDISSAPPVLPAAVSGQHIWLIDKPDAVQTQIRVGKLGIREGDPDFIPVEVMNRIFGGGYNSILNTEVRVKKGLTYGAYSQFNPHRYAGSFGVGTFTRTEKTVEAAKLVVDLLSNMSTGRVTPEQLNFARDYLAGAYPIQSETAEQVADRVLTVAAYGLPADYNRTYPQKIRAVSSTEVDAMAKRYLGTDDLDIVLAGNVSSFRDELKKAFPNAKYEEISFDQVDILAPDLRKAKLAEAAATPESLEQGKQILLAAAKAMGGPDLESVKTIAMTENGKQLSARGDVPITVKWTVAYPDHSHGDVSYGGQSVTQVCDGKAAWIVMGGQAHDVTRAIGEFERGIALFGGGWGFYQEVLAGRVKGQALGETEIDGKETDGVAVEAPFGNVKLYFDSSTHLLSAARFQSATAQGPVETEQHWSDYRDVDGHLFAFSTATYRSGEKFIESSVGDVKVNAPANDSLFAKPEAASSK
ncbi:MAG TPA: pitrilysin family protein [Candidatus Limnocylindrales bacterium]|nr:pitrilysin family protein [Candidatus Limnocylindrales bacterium]